MEKLKQLISDFNPSLEAILDVTGSPERLYEPISYLLSLGGKRIRPALVMASYRMYSDTYNKDVLLLAQAIELFHNFTLMHDDIIDKAALRRGQATVHKKWDKSTAILSGDLLQIMVYEKLALISDHRILPMFNSMAIELCEGQMKDIQFEEMNVVENEAYLDMIRQKTAVLIGFALEAGALLGGSSESDAKKLYQLGIDVGLAFQLMDDFLDSFGSQAAVGKRIGGDILERKKTYLWNAMWAKLNDDDRKGLKKAFQLEEEETIGMVKDTMVVTGAKDAAHQLAMRYSKKAYNSLETIKCPKDKSYVEEIVSLLAVRSF